MNFKRWCKHLCAPLREPRAFDEATLARIGQAISEAERGHGGEIRFAVESRLPESYLWKNLPARARAVMVFSKLRVWDTEANNGVLIYVLLAERAVEIVADRAAARVITQAKWDDVVALMRSHFRKHDFGGGAVAGVHAIGALLAAHFPLNASEPQQNELTNAPTIL